MSWGLGMAESVDIEKRIKALEADVHLNVKEIMIAFKRLKDVEIQVEEICKKLQMPIGKRG